MAETSQEALSGIMADTVANLSATVSYWQINLKLRLYTVNILLPDLAVPKLLFV